jgi:hypothetical protein
MKIRMPAPTEHARCKYCGYLPTSQADEARHKAGLDPKRLECPLQDVDAIKEREKAHRLGPVYRW